MSISNLRTILRVGLGLALFACDRGEEAADQATPAAPVAAASQPEPVAAPPAAEAAAEPAEDAAPGPDDAAYEAFDPKVAQAARLARDIEAKPAEADALLAGAGLDRDQLEALMYEISRDPTLTEQYRIARSL